MIIRISSIWNRRKINLEAEKWWGKQHSCRLGTKSGRAPCPTGSAANG